MRTTAKQLREFLATVPDDSIIVVEGSDHSFRTVRPQKIEALEDGKQLFEYYGPEYRTSAKQKVVPAVLIN